MSDSAKPGREFRTDPVFSLLLSIQLISLLPVWRQSSRKISRFTFQRMLSCKPPLSLPPSASLHPHRPPLYFPTAAERALPVFLPLHFCAPALNKKKVQGFVFTLFFSVVFFKTRRILGKWRSRFQGVLMEISIQCYSLSVSSARLSALRVGESSDCRDSRNRTDNFLLSGPEAAAVASITTRDPVRISQNSPDSLRRSVHVSSVWKQVSNKHT